MPLDGIGQRNETVRVRISQMAERLEDLKTLTEDFSLLVEPVDGLLLELPQAKARILETEALLAQELEMGQILRREVDNLSSRLSAASGELSTASLRSQKLENLLREQEAAADEQRLSLREKTLLVDNLERQLLAETEQVQAMTAEIKAQRADAQATDQALLRAERTLAETLEQRTIFEQENRRLQQLVEDQAGRIVALNGRCSELDQQAESSFHMIATLEVQLSNEHAARQKSEAHFEADLAAVNTERSSLALKVDALTARLAATDQILAQVRGQLRDKDEALRLAERSVKDATIERSNFDRRLESVRADLNRHVAQVQEGQRLRAELESRCDMLVKALAAKDAALESANTKAGNLSDRVDALTRRFEHDRLGLEAVNRRLIEELQNEKAERTLAQGALDIARESRFSLQRQNESLKRTARTSAKPIERGPEADEEDGGGRMRGLEDARSSNVRFFTPPEKTE